MSKASFSYPNDNKKTPNNRSCQAAFYNALSFKATSIRQLLHLAHSRSQSLLKVSNESCQLNSRATHAPRAAKRSTAVAGFVLAHERLRSAQTLGLTFLAQSCIE